MRITGVSGPEFSYDLSFENITDADYRIHGSGQNRPGRSAVVALRIDF